MKIYNQHTLEPCELGHWLMYQQPCDHADQQQSSLTQNKTKHYKTSSEQRHIFIVKSNVS